MIITVDQITGFRGFFTNSGRVREVRDHALFKVGMLF